MSDKEQMNEEESQEEGGPGLYTEDGEAIPQFDPQDLNESLKRERANIEFSDIENPDSALEVACTLRSVSDYVEGFLPGLGLGLSEKEINRLAIPLDKCLQKYGGHLSAPPEAALALAAFTVFYPRYRMVKQIQDAAKAAEAEAEQGEESERGEE